MNQVHSSGLNMLSSSELDVFTDSDQEWDLVDKKDITGQGKVGTEI